MATTTVRESIVQHLIELFEGVVVGEPVSDPYTWAWSKVTTDPILDLKLGKRAVLGVYDTGEQATPRTWPLTEAVMRVAFEFHVKLERGESRKTILQGMLGEVQRRLFEDHTLGGLASEVLEQGSEFDIDGQFDRQPSGTLWVTIRYRRNTMDPRTQV